MFDLTRQEVVKIVTQMRAAHTDTQRCEAKACAGGLPREIGNSISAFANGQGGLILCGIDEKSGFKPAPGFDPVKMQDALANYCGDKMTPPIRPIIDFYEFEGATVMGAYIPELRPSDKPCFITAAGPYSGSYLRVGDGDRRMTTYEVNQLIREQRQPDFDKRLIEEAPLGCFDDDLLAAFLRRERKVHARNFKQLDDQTAMAKLHVIGQDESGEWHPTLAGLLAFGAYPQEFFPSLNVTFSCYPGLTKDQAAKDGRRFLDMQTCEGPVSYMVEDALQVLQRNMRTGGKVVGAGRSDVPDYPLEAVREALVNALMHRDYAPDACGSSVHMDLYADRLEISNPGGLCGSTTIEELNSLLCDSSRRNQVLARLLESTPCDTVAGQGFVAENRGTGYVVMRSAMERAGKPAPVPCSTLTRFTVTLYREMEPGALAGALAGEAPDASVGEHAAVAAGNLDAIEYAIVSLAREQETVGVTELVASLDRSRPTVLKRVQHLTQAGVLVPTAVKNSPKQRYALAASWK